MVKPIMKDVFFLSQKSEPATKEDMQVVQDLLLFSTLNDTQFFTLNEAILG